MNTLEQLSPDHGILICGHGSRARLAAEEFGQLASGLRALFFTAASAQIFGYYDSNPVSDIKDLDGFEYPVPSLLTHERGTR